MLKKRVIISACLLGEFCRYDGKTKINSGVVKKYDGFEIVAFCPEAPIFGTPRERISLVEVDDEYFVLTEKTNIDVTQKLKNEINSFIDLNSDAQEIVLKSKSPSCGLGTTPIFDKNRNFLKYGNGIAADIFLNRYRSCDIKDENQI